MMRLSVLSAFLALLVSSGAAFAQEQDRIADAEIGALVGLLEGEFDSKPQMMEDLASGVPTEQRHYRINRSFLTATSEDIEGPIVVGTTIYAGQNWHFDQNEFLVWTFEKDTESGEVVAKPRRFVDQVKKLPFSRDMERLGPISSAELEDAIGGSACPIRWIRDGDSFLGKVRHCEVKSAVHKVILDWEWDYLLTREALFISFAGKNAAGEILDGTPVGAPYRLDRVNGHPDGNP